MLLYYVAIAPLASISVVHFSLKQKTCKIENVACNKLDKFK